ncbi:hypothetical protein GCM10020295_32580 [Streptomyces cinereospinus]
MVTRAARFALPAVYSNLSTWVSGGVGDAQVRLERGGLRRPAEGPRRAGRDGGAERDLPFRAHADLVVGRHAEGAERVRPGADEHLAGGAVAARAQQHQQRAAEQPQDQARRDGRAVPEQPAQLVAELVRFVVPVVVAGGAGHGASWVRGWERGPPWRAAAPVTGPGTAGRRRAW